MHNAPAVSFPVGRSRFQGWLLSAAWLAGAAACAYWASVMDGMGWRHALAFAMPLAAGAAACAGWQRQVSGTLHWDGVCWRLEMAALKPTFASMSAATSAPTSALTGNLAVHLDFQGFLLLSMRLETGGVRWLWLDQCAELTRWQALRRAVHSSAAGELRQPDPSNATSTDKAPSQKAQA